ncbi:hypothetical protein CAPTEDRAFT_200065 [Capitella teleta]|uniref:SHSP domain-containing protein n=1 Tax=Capitella teleta TaxID=283909 RepID=R7TPS6_CAPTE|nr:hypothetical protein CAPTEDRAFT_200065 [Capitella teleta]|eukprot:ELT95868.1 hypothetical protein CAPTEDRAFT_200065 [Capitella teleta]
MMRRKVQQPPSSRTMSTAGSTRSSFQDSIKHRSMSMSLMAKSSFTSSHNEETAVDSDLMEANWSIALPEDIRKRTLRWARMGPMRLCLFSLRKKKEQEVTGVEEDSDNKNVENQKDKADADKPQFEMEWVKVDGSEFATEVGVRSFQSEDLSVSRKKNAVIVNAKRREEDGKRSLRKTIFLPEDVRVESIRCSLSGDLLKITTQRSLTYSSRCRRCTCIADVTYCFYQYRCQFEMSEFGFIISC